jgi:Arm DNA-binding domain
MGVRSLSRLSALKVTKTKDPGLYEDGGGLRLIVTEKGTKRWALRITVRGRRVEKGLGLYPEVSLEAARRRAAELRYAAKAGVDLQKQEKSAHLTTSVTFRSAFEQFFAVRRQRLSNGKHVQQWENTMRDYVFPAIGNLPVADIGAAELLEVLTPIWFEKPETASRVLQRLKATFDSAILRGFREKANPCTGISSELGICHRKVQHHPALHWRDVPEFFRSLDSRDMQQSSRSLFKFLILTACRSGEARGATWKEVNFDDRTWIIPADR